MNGLGSHVVSRRHFLRLAVVVGGAGALAAACAAPSPPAPTHAPAGAPTSTGKYQEASALADLVKQGKLPPVDQRLPLGPVVLQPIERTGVYGGTWRMALLGGQDTAWLVRTIGYENLVRWNREWKTVEPNVAESFDVSPDASQFTFKLRNGLRWSDGEPFTADDIVFWYDDYLTNTELNPGGPWEWMMAGGQAGTVTKLDDYTVVFKFSAPNGLLLQKLATPDAQDVVRYPRHYLQQFHKKYNPNVDQLVAAAGAPDWMALFRQKGTTIPGTPYDARWQNPDLPSLNAWSVTSAYGQGTRVVAERNPYYWKVDPAGRQLPYLDRVVYDVMQDKEVLTLKALNGEIDMMSRHFNTLQNKAVFTENMDKSQYHFFDFIPSSMNTMIIALNLNHKDPTMRQIFQNKNFRIGLSHAINRKEIIDLVYIGQGEPYQAGPRPESQLYNERLARQYTEYDPDKANQVLDQAGYTQRDGDGFRLGPNGQRISFQVETTSGANPDWTDALKLIQGYWQRVGIDMQVKSEDRSLLYSRKEASEHDAVVWGGDGGLEVVLEPRWYFPYSNESNFAQAWRVWYNPGAAGGIPRTAPEQPPADMRRQMQLYDQIKATGDEQKQQELMRQLLEISADQFYVIGISLPATNWGLVKNNFHNVPSKVTDAWLYPAPGPTDPPQYFLA
jgi:peptide/nickel transport system substrate-binding protein